MTQQKTGEVVYQASWAWWEIVEGRGEIVLCAPFDGEDWEFAMDVSPNFSDSWCTLVEEVDERHTAIRPGDYACCDGYGDDVYFVRIS